VSRRESTEEEGDGRVTALSDESFNTSEYRALRLLFRDESREALEQATHLLLRADRLAPDALDELLRLTHSLKGTAGTVGMRGFADAAHRLEGVLERLRAGALPWSVAVRDSIVEVIDGLRALADAAEDEAERTEMSRRGAPCPTWSPHRTRWSRRPARPTAPPPPRSAATSRPSSGSTRCASIA
jgi:chemotaxis protein histidine kinase CheA